MKFSLLCQAGRSPSLPLSIELGQDELLLQRWLRVLPGQRYVAQAQWQGRAVLAKLMVGGRAERHFTREREGAQALAGQGLATPALLAEGYQAGAGGWLLFEYLDDACSLWDAWNTVAHEAPLSAGQQAVLGAALEVVARMHARGLWQSDLHLDNLLHHAGQLYLIDGGGVHSEQVGKPLSRQRVLENLGLFFAQLPSVLDPFIEELLVHYILANDSHALPMEALLDEIGKARARRLRDYLGKLGRDCSLFSVTRGLAGLEVVRRQDKPELEALLADPDAFIGTGRPLKQGGSATVAEVEAGGRTLVIKRYNIKGFTHWLKRFWRPTRAWHSWVEGNRLNFLGIATPEPLALLERRTLGLRGRSYLITEYAGGEDIITRFRPYLDGNPPEAELQALVRLLQAMLRERISHGDMKGTNLLWKDGDWLLIDLDATRQHRDERSFHQAFARDRARLLRNWPTDSALHLSLDRRLPNSSCKLQAASCK
ncbi:lipopolysaccharide kinase InaA family protein [Stutzerimonas kirkiae]|uniref:lipopolysaccharide kinase InaA family protein n=1 Tax=Stutzerimonas kirkiae TaxID=2211392 RepID=UPI00103845C0|nr:lipopolysaccharide kinase InaA family protein [Stutzerimonas kirkiae]TBV13237.1 serine/threonine protein kinase [Stutzerimonas kirkiae]